MPTPKPDPVSCTQACLFATRPGGGGLESVLPAHSTPLRWCIATLRLSLKRSLVRVALTQTLTQWNPTFPTRFFHHSLSLLFKAVATAAASSIFPASGLWLGLLSCVVRGGLTPLPTINAGRGGLFPLRLCGRDILGVCKAPTTLCSFPS